MRYATRTAWGAMLCALALPMLLGRFTVPAQAEHDSERQLCALAAAESEAAHRLPPELLQAMAVVESGRWPWVVRARGKGYMLDSQADAVALVEKLHGSGVKDIIVGCMQINLRYHGDAFADFAEALEPSANAAYAGRFLNSLHDGESWWDAVARYQGGTPSARKAYVTKVAAVWQNGAAAKPKAAPPPAPLADAPFEPDVAGVLDLTAFPNLSFPPRRPVGVVLLVAGFRTDRF
jgi:hypothetical protein